MEKLLRSSGLFVMFIVLISCSEEYTPKPKAYPRINLPESAYQSYSTDCPFRFEHQLKSVISYPNPKMEPCWININYPTLNCRIHLSYRKIEGNLNSLLEDSRGLVYKHTVKASAINQKDIVDKSRKIFAVVYEIEGDAASSVQFFATDSLHHFLRGALYFNASSNADSLAPAITFMREEVYHIVESLNWK